MKKFTITISDEAMEQVRNLIGRQSGLNDEPDYPINDTEAIRELFFIDDHGYEDVDVRSEVTVEPA